MKFSILFYLIIFVGLNTYQIKAQTAQSCESLYISYKENLDAKDYEKARLNWIQLIEVECDFHSDFQNEIQSDRLFKDFFSSIIESYETKRINEKEFIERYYKFFKSIHEGEKIIWERFEEKQKTNKFDSLQWANIYLTFSDNLRKVRINSEEQIAQIFDCKSLIEHFENEYEKNKNDLDWLYFVSYSLRNLATRCDSEFLNDLDVQLKKVNCKRQHGYFCTQLLAIQWYRRKEYKKAIPGLIELYNEEIEKEKMKGTWAYFIGHSYHKLEEFESAIQWYKLAAKHKPSAAPYAQIATIFGNKERINSCGKDAVQKLSAYLVAADYMWLASKYDSKFEKYAKQYQEIFPNFNGFPPLKKGEKIYVDCYGGAYTFIR